MSSSTFYAYVYTTFLFYFSCIDRSSDENAKADLWTSLNELNPGGGNQITFGIICYIIWIHRRVQHTFFSRSTSETGRANKIELNKKQKHFFLMWKILKMSRTLFKCLIVHWKTFAIFVIPSLLLPVALIDGTATFRCAYVALVMALFWYFQPSTITCNFSRRDKLPCLIIIIKFIAFAIKQFSFSFMYRTLQEMQ